MKESRAVSTVCEVDVEFFKISCRCEARKLEGPGAEAMGKERTVDLIFWSRSRCASGVFSLGHSKDGSE